MANNRKRPASATSACRATKALRPAPLSDSNHILPISGPIGRVAARTSQNPWSRPPTRDEENQDQEHQENIPDQASRNLPYTEHVVTQDLTLPVPKPAARSGRVHLSDIPREELPKWHIIILQCQLWYYTRRQIVHNATTSNKVISLFKRYLPNRVAEPSPAEIKLVYPFTGELMKVTQCHMNLTSALKTHFTSGSGLSHYDLPEDGNARAGKVGKLLQNDNFVYTHYSI
jgi:hypothetical protein